MSPKATLRIMAGPAHCYLVPAQEGYVLVDAGSPGIARTLTQALIRHGILPREIRLILVTHGHHDHIGSLAAIKEESGARVLVQQADAPLVRRGAVVRPPGTSPYGKVLAAMVAPLSYFIRLRPCQPDVVMEEEETSLTAFGLAGRVLHTPGHTAGSLSLLLDSGEAFVGDLCFNVLPFGWGPLLPPFGDDVATIYQSWQKLLDAGAKLIYPAHGAPFLAERLRERLAAHRRHA